MASALNSTDNSIQMPNKEKIRFITLLIGIAIFFYGCVDHNGKNKACIDLDTDSLMGNLVADTMIYDIIVINRDSTDLWKDESLKYFKRRAFIDSLFALAYAQKADAFDLFTGKKLSRNALKKIEAKDGFSRDKIGKIQFREIWYFNSEYAMMHKKVYSIVLGVEDYSESGVFRGYTPVFKLNLN